MKNRYIVLAPLVLCASIWTTGALAVTVTCEVCTITCISVNNVEHCSRSCFAVPCGGVRGGGLQFEMSPTIKAKNGAACTVRVKTPQGTSVSGKVSGHTCVLERPLHVPQ